MGSGLLRAQKHEHEQVSQGQDSAGGAWTRRLVMGLVNPLHEHGG